MPDRSVAPLATAIGRPNLPTTEEIVLREEVPLVILNQGSQPVVLFEMVIPTGRWQETLPDLTYYTFKMLTEGTASKSSEAIASAFDFYGSHLEIAPSLDGVSLKLYALNKFFPQLMELLTELLTESVFPEKEFQTLKQIRIQSIRQEHAKNNAYANLKFRELLFGEAHPYGFMTNEALTGRIQLTDIIQHQKMLQTRPVVFLAGQVDDRILLAVEQSFRKLTFQPSGQAVPEPPLPKAHHETITREDSTQASLRMGFVSIDRHHADIHRLKVANELLGGFFGSRLMKNIREDKGLTYGIRSGFIHMQEASYWSLSSELLRDKLDVAQSEISKEISRLKNETPSRKEFDMVINYMKGKFLSSFDSPFSAQAMIKSLRIAGLTEEYLFDYFETLQSIEPRQVCDIAQKYFDEAKMSSLVVV